MCVQKCIIFFVLLHTKAKTLGLHRGRSSYWSQLMIRAAQLHFSKLFTVLKQTVIDSSVLRIQLSHQLLVLWFRSPFGSKGTSVCRDVHLEFSEPFPESPKGHQQAEFPNDPCKQSWRGADNKGLLELDTVCMLYCMFVCIYYVSDGKANQGSKRMIQLSTKDRMTTSRGPFQPAGVIFTTIHGCSTILLHSAYSSW